MVLAARVKHINGFLATTCIWPTSDDNDQQRVVVLDIELTGHLQKVLANSFPQYSAIKVIIWVCRRTKGFEPASAAFQVPSRTKVSCEVSRAGIEQRGPRFQMRSARSALPVACAISMPRICLLKVRRRAVD